MKKNILFIYETADELLDFKNAFAEIPGVFNFFYAFTAKEGFQLLKRNTIDIAFVKYGLSQVNGLELVAAARGFAKLRTVKIYLYEDEITREQSEMARVLGASGCIEKKSDISVFVHELRAIINPQLLPNYVFLPKKVSLNLSAMLQPDPNLAMPHLFPQTLETWFSSQDRSAASSNS